MGNKKHIILLQGEREREISNGQKGPLLCFQIIESWLPSSFHPFKLKIMGKSLKKCNVCVPHTLKYGTSDTQI